MSPSSLKRKRGQEESEDDLFVSSEPPKRKTQKPNTSTRIKSEEPDPPTDTIARIPNAKAPETIFGNIVFVFVGPSQAKFGIHEGLLQRASSLFKAAIVGGPIPESDIESSCQEDGAKALWLRNEDPVIFKRLNDWLYTGRVTTTGEKCKDLSWSLLIDIYIFGERRNIPAFQNTCVNTVIQKCNDGAPFPGQATVNTLWNNQGDVWPLQRLILHLFAAKCDLKAALMKNSGYPQRFLHDLVIILYESKVKPETDVGDDFWAIRKNYHVHKSENPITID